MEIKIRSSNTTLNTVAEFVERCRSLADIADAYDVFEFECSPLLRAKIYAMGEEDDSEPFRCAMHNLGFRNY